MEAGIRKLYLCVFYILWNLMFTLHIVGRKQHMQCIYLGPQIGDHYNDMRIF